MALPKTRKSRSKPKYVGQFLVVLPGTDPLVWRRILVPEVYTFWDLHVAIQDAMGWMDSHLHEFEIVDPGGRLERIGIPLDDLDDVRPTAAGSEVPISKVFVHGAGACPPEDVGGTRGYADFLQIIRDPDHPEHGKTQTWVGGAFDPHAFDPASVTFDDPRKRWRTAFQER